ncbi:MAG: acetyl-CoA carboxylase carboxyltransferase subunit beta, partial [Candidatus Latescibacteria bacterium]|nr:acetyl-CoA carboxylase carboxyltransferase subunit beta [Candidatus Latescibacterota bacterium]
ISDRKISLSVHDGSFLAGTMGSVVGEKVTRSVRRSLDQKIPLVVIATSGGARMQEGILSLMQMAKTSLWLTRLSKEKIPYVVILTNPTMAGVMASYASLGDFTLAEPGAMLGFAGLRVIEQMTGSSLPEGFQTAEFFFNRGFIDQVTSRSQLRDSLINILGFFPDREK